MIISGEGIRTSLLCCTQSKESGESSSVDSSVDSSVYSFHTAIPSSIRQTCFVALVTHLQRLTHRVFLYVALTHTLLPSHSLCLQQH